MISKIASNIVFLLAIVISASAAPVDDYVSSDTRLIWSQEYVFETIGNLPEGNIVRITNLGTRKCVENKNAVNSNGNEVVMQDCNNGASQMWIQIPVGEYDFQLKNVGSGKCIDVDGQSTSNGARLSKQPCGEQYSQQWKVDAQNHIIGRSSGKCIDIHQQNAGKGVRQLLWRCGDSSVTLLDLEALE